VHSVHPAVKPVEASLLGALHSGPATPAGGVEATPGRCAAEVCIASSMAKARHSPRV
jgi:hypothetical protein